MENEFKLIEGEFSAQDAAKVLFPLISSKIKFHSLEGFSNEIRFGNDHSNSKKRIDELQQAQVSLQELLVFAEHNDSKLKINCTIKIEFE